MKQSFELIGIPDNINEFIQKLPLPVCIISLEKEILAYNRAFFLMAGREVRQGVHYCHEFLNFSFCHDGCLADMATKLGRTINWDESHGRRKSNEELIVRPMVTPLADEVGAPQGYILLFQDTTDEVQLYRNFRANLDHLERKVAFLQTLNDAADEFRKVTQVNALMHKITDFVVEHLAMDCCQFIQHQKEEDTYVAVSTSRSSEPDFNEQQVQQLVNTIKADIGTLQNSNEPYMVHQVEPNMIDGIEQGRSLLLPIRSNTQDYGFLATFQFQNTEDISQEKLEYLDLFGKSIGPYIENSHIISNLESIVAERTRELNKAQSQLVESTRLASVGETAGMVAHEVLNPMTAVLAKLQKLQGDEGPIAMIKLIAEGWGEDYSGGGIEQLIETLTEKPEDDEDAPPLIEEDLQNLKESAVELKKDLHFIEAQLNRIVGIVDNLRGLSRSAKSTAMIDVTQSIQTADGLTKDGLAKHKIEMVTEFNHRSKINCDPNELVQILHNLIRNAMQAIERNGIITVSTSETEQRLEIRIKDSGSGIAEEIAPKIFEMRFTTKPASEGTGLGLGLSRRLARQAFGDLTLEDRGGQDKGHGAVFLVWFPKASNAN
ncbi:ATP-binding protein [Deltaproteobacteria bacterium TL4]